MFNNHADYDNSLGARHISANLGDYEAARSSFFTFIVDDLDNIVKATVQKDRPVGEYTQDEVIPNAQDGLRLNVLASSVPHFTLEVLKFRRGNELVKFAGTPDWDEGELKVDDVVGIDTKSILMAWQALAYDVKSRKGGRMKDYKKTCTLAEYTQDFELIRQWKLYGCWISKLSEDSFDKEQDGKRSISVTIPYDRAEMLGPDES